MTPAEVAAILNRARHERRICELGEDLVEIRLAGEVDGFDAGGLREDLEWAAGRDAHVLLDLCCCEFLDSAALAVLVFARQNLAACGRELVAVGGGTQVQRLFEVTGLSDLLVIAEDRDAAISRLWPGRPIPETAGSDPAASAGYLAPSP